MVEVVTSEEFIEFQKSIEQRLDGIEKKLNALIKDVNEKQAQEKTYVEEAIKDIDMRIDDLEESSKGFIDRLRDAIRPRQTEASRELITSDTVGNPEKTLGRVAEVIMRCPNFFNWDWCQDNCPIYRICDDIATVQDISKLSQKDSIERLKGALKRIGDFLQSKPEESSRARG